MICVCNNYTYLTNRMIPVFSICLKIPFHDANMQYCCFAVRGDRGSEGGGGRSKGSLKSEVASCDNLHPILIFIERFLTTKFLAQMCFNFKCTKIFLCI